ncbi:MAG: MFS transporter [Actinomycetota bacterium]|nr:MFS transporter [Actinomycetota bacterium]
MSTAYPNPQAQAKPQAEQGNYRWYVLAVIFVGTFMGPLDSSIVNIALPVVAKEFGVGITTIEWVVMAYLLTTSSLLLSVGRLGDMIGHKRVYIFGFVAFTAASALCGFAGSIEQLIGFRALQAIGATSLFASAPAIITDVFPPHERGKALGTIGTSVAIGLTAGPFLGGLIIGALDWRWIFFINIPIGIIVVILALAIIRESRAETGKRFDILGATTGFGALFSILLALSMGNTWGWGSAPTIGLFAASAVFAMLFIRTERRVSDPMLDLSLFHNRLFAAANISALINYIALFVVLILIPFYLFDIFKETPQRAGIVLMSVPLLMGVAAPISGTLSDKIGSRMLSSLGLGITAVALYGLTWTSTETGVLPVAVLLSLIGLGSGLFQSPNSNAIMGIVPRNRLGIASAMQATMRNVGMVLGVAMSGAIVATIAPKGHADPNLLSAIHTAFTAGAITAALGMVTSLVRGPAAPQAPRGAGE